MVIQPHFQNLLQESSKYLDLKFTSIFYHFHKNWSSLYLYKWPRIIGYVPVTFIFLPAKFQVDCFNFKRFRALLMKQVKNDASGWWSDDCDFDLVHHFGSQSHNFWPNELKFCMLLDKCHIYKPHWSDFQIDWLGTIPAGGHNVPLPMNRTEKIAYED